jgi:ribonuclease P protein component
MVISALRRSDRDPTVRVAVVAGRSVGDAVRRNRAKRRLRAAARQARLPDGTDLVIDACHAALTLPFDSLQRDVERLSARASRRAFTPAEPGRADGSPGAVAALREIHP